MSSAKELREARRRKILERGGDRLAFITGQVKSLPPAGESTAPAPVLASPPGESGLKSLSIAGAIPPSNDGLLPTGGSAHDVRKFSPSLSDISRKLNGVRDELQSLDSGPEETQSLLLPPLIPAPALSTSQHLEAAAPRGVPASSKASTSFNYSALVKSIDHSVVLRAILAFCIGVALVIQWTYSKCHHSWAFGSQNYILSWPVFLVVVTDVTVVLGKSLLGSEKVSSVPGKEKFAGGLEVFRDARVEQMLAFTSQLEVICTVSIAQHFQPALCTYIGR